jgi:hypothetical protein
MARRVDEFPAQAQSSRYPWNEWLDGSIWELVPGEDFKGQLNTFRSVASMHSRKRGGSAKTRIVRGKNGEKDKLYIQFKAAAPEQTRLDA